MIAVSNFFFYNDDVVHSSPTTELSVTDCPFAYFFPIVRLSTVLILCMYSPCYKYECHLQIQKSLNAAKYFAANTKFPKIPSYIEQKTVYSGKSLYNCVLAKAVGSTEPP